MKSLAAADRHGYPRYVANQVYYSLVGRDYEWELTAARSRSRASGRTRLEPARLGRLTGKIRRGEPWPEGSRRTDTAAFGPPRSTRKSSTTSLRFPCHQAGNRQTVPQIAINCFSSARPFRVSLSARAMKSSSDRTSAPSAGASPPRRLPARRGECDDRPLPLLPLLPAGGLRAINPPSSEEWTCTQAAKPAAPNGPAGHLPKASPGNIHICDTWVESESALSR